MLSVGEKVHRLQTAGFGKGFWRCANVFFDWTGSGGRFRCVLEKMAWRGVRRWWTIIYIFRVVVTTSRDVMMGFEFLDPRAR